MGISGPLVGQGGAWEKREIAYKKGVDGNLKPKGVYIGKLRKNRGIKNGSEEKKKIFFSNMSN